MRNHSREIMCMLRVSICYMRYEIFHIHTYNFRSYIPFIVFIFLLHTYLYPVNNVLKFFFSINLTYIIEHVMKHIYV